MSGHHRLCRLAGAAAVVLALHGAAAALPSFDDVHAGHRPSDVEFLDRHGVVVQRLRVDAQGRRGRWTSLADVSPAMRAALVWSEDRRFFEHGGVDWRAVSAAAWGNLWNRRARGASTITMQLAGLLDEDWRARSGGRSVGAKLGQMAAARALESHWRKDQILEAYLNLVPLRGEIVGIDAMARTYFGKNPNGLDDQEAALAAALVRAPNANPAQAAERACAVWRELRATPSADCTGLRLWVGATLSQKAWPASEGLAPHAARHILREQAAAASRSRAALSSHGAGTREVSPRVATTLDARIQASALASLRRHLAELRGRQVDDGAVVVLDNASGDVLAWVGSSGNLSAAAEVDAVLAQRQPGSTLKPFLYVQALEERRLTAASLLEDAPTAIATDNGLYVPQNYDRRYKSWVSVRTALGSSLNVPAVRALALVTPDAHGRQLRRLGLELSRDGDHHGYSLALGSAEVNLLQLTNAYRALANGGLTSGTRVLPGAAPRVAAHRVVDSGAAFVVGDILSDRLARARTFGTDSVLATRVWSAVKTGTSKDMRDNWALGFTQRYTVGVWVGNASGRPMHGVSGTSGAAPVWADIVAALHERAPSRAPVPPPSVVSQRIEFADQTEAPRAEWFLRGTEQARFSRVDEVRHAAVTSPARITTPTPGTIIALDPDIPPQRQRLHFAAPGHRGGWRLNGQAVAQGSEWQWLPLPGRHVVTIHDAHGQALDEIRIEVRGAGLRRASGRTPA